MIKTQKREKEQIFMPKDQMAHAKTPNHNPYNTVRKPKLSYSVEVRVGVGYG